MRRTGIEAVGDVDWGTHFCQFYETRQDLIDLLVPYFRAGLAANEYCMWVTCAPLGVDAAKAALRESVPDLDEQMAQGRIDILDHRQWYLRSGVFSADEVLKGWVDRLEAARRRGFEGLRLTGNTFWLEASDWRDFTRYEETVNNVIGQHRMLALCTYSLEKCRTTEIIDVVANHQFALVKRAGRWECIESRSHKQAQIALRDSEERFRTFMNNSPAVAWMKDADGRHVYLSESYQKRFNVRFDEWRGKTDAELWPAPVAQEFRKNDLAVLASGRPITVIEEAPGPDGARRFWLNSKFLFQDASDQTYVGGIGVDITEHRLAEQKIRRQNAILAAISRIFREALTCDTDEQFGRVCLAVAGELTQSAFGFLSEIDAEGQTRDVAINSVAPERCRTGTPLGHGTHATKLRSRGVLGRVLFDGGGLFTNDLSSHPDSVGLPEGHPEVRTFLGAPLRHAGKTIGMIAVANRPGGYAAEDLEALEALTPAIVQALMRRRAERTLRDSEEKYRSIVETAQEGILIGALDGRILFANQKMADLLGYAREEMVGRVGLEFMDDADRPAVLRNRAVLESGRPTRAEYRFRRKDGATLWTLVSAAALRDGAGQHVANLAMHTDITERKRAEQALGQARDDLEIRVKERTDELHRTNRALQDEIIERRRAEETAQAERRRLYDVLETLPVYVVLLAQDHHVPFANRFFRERFGESQGRRCYEYLFGRADVCENCESYKALKTGAPHRWEWTGPDGRDYDIYDFPFKDTDGSPLVMEMGIDVTERKRAEAALRLHQNQLQNLVRERTSELEDRNAQLLTEVADRKRAEAQLQAVLDHLTEGLVIADLDGNLFHWNPAAVAMHGFDNMDECRRRLTEFTEIFELSTAEEGVLPLTQWPLARILRGETLRDWEVTLSRRGRDGWRRIFSYGGTLARDAAGQPLLAVVSVTDVTARKQTEQALRESGENLARAQAVAHVGSWRLDVRRNQLIWSDETYRMFGIPLGTPLTYESFVGCVHPDDRAHVDLKWRAALRGAPYDLEHRIMVGEGVKWVRERVELEFEPDGTLKGGFGTVQDVTERKRAETALQQAHDTLEQRVEERTEELRQVNQTLRMISDCNQALVRAATEDELVREICQTIHDRGGYRFAWVGYAEHDATKSVRPVAAVGLDDGSLEPIRTTWADEPNGRGPTGRCIRTGRVCVGRDFLGDPELAPWRGLALARGFRSSIALPLMSEGRAFGALTICSDQVGTFDEQQAKPLSELADDLAFGIVALRARVERDHARQVAEERARQLTTLATELGRVEQRERQRLAGVLHDHLQQLLVGAKYDLAFVEGTLRRGSERRSLRRITGTLDAAIDSARTLTAELSPPILREKGLADALSWLGRQMKQKYDLTVQLHADRLAEPGDEQVRFFLFDAVRELLFNVVKHAGVNRVGLELARLGDHQIQVVVADSGAGFDRARLETAEPTGFGLFGIRERLRCLGGRMTVESRPGHGSRFTLVASAAAPSPAQEPAQVVVPRDESRIAPPPAAVRRSGGRVRVLLADDHAVMRAGLARLLNEQPDLEVVGEAGDGQEAAELARTLRPDVVLMDVSMPRSNGVDATRRLARELPGLRIVGLSMHENSGMAEAMREAGAADYLTKSGPPERIVAAIRAAVAPSTPPRPEQSEAKRARRRTGIRPASPPGRRATGRSASASAAPRRGRSNRKRQKR